MKHIIPLLVKNSPIPVKTACKFVKTVSIAVFARLFLVSMFLLTASCGFTSCQYKQAAPGWAPKEETAIDSAEFRGQNHYWRGDNFSVTNGFSARMRPSYKRVTKVGGDTLIGIKAGDIVVVKSIVRDTTSVGKGTVWVQIVAEQSIMLEGGRNTVKPVTGWVKERRFIQNVVPDHPVSKIIHTLANPTFRSVLYVMALLLILLGTWTLWRRWRSHRPLLAIVNPYVLMLNMVMSGALVLHRSIWHYVPDTWEEFYFHPSLNPFNPELPPVIAFFVLSLWVLLIVTLAAINAHRRVSVSFVQWLRAVLFIFITALILFGVFAVVIPFGLLYVTLAFYWIYAFWRYRRLSRGQLPYVCGHCGSPLERLGRCPHCGAINE